MSKDLLIYSDRVFFEDELKPATILISDNKITAVLPGMIQLGDSKFQDFGNDVIMPGVIDAHVHVNEPGRTDWEGFDTATRAAAAGGITTIVDMPLNATPVTTTVQNLRKKLLACQGKLHVNCGFWGGLVPENLNDLEKLIKAGVLGIKAFLCHSGIMDFPNVTKETLDKGMAIIAKYDIPILAHCEVSSDHRHRNDIRLNKTSYQAWLNSRPQSWEMEAIDWMIELCEKHNCKTHIVHLSAGDALSKLAGVRRQGLPLTVETAPHYLYFNAEEIPDGDTRFKCAPPIRSAHNNKKLWVGLQLGLIDLVATDHSPAPPERKELETGNLSDAWGGISSLQLLLPIIWTMAKKDELEFKNIVNWLSEKPAQLAGLEHRKGKIKANYDADLVVWKPESKFKVDANKLQHRHKVCPYHGEELFGLVTATFVNGEKVFENGKIKNKNKGKILKRKK